MSYILDALRKSDQQRQRGAAPTLLTPQANTRGPEQPAYLLHGALAAALIGAGILIGWLRPWEPEHPVSATAPVADAPLNLRPTVKVIPPPPVLTESVISQDRQSPVQSAAPPAQAGSAPAGAVIKPGMPARAATETRRAPAKPGGAVAGEAAASVPAAVTAPAKSAGDQRVVAMSELPVAVQQEIPRMSIAVHAYSSDRNGRLVMINERLLREGAQLDPNLRLEEITPDGMIFTFREYRFHLRAPGAAGRADTQSAPAK